MAQSLKSIPDKCTGCMQCELACSWVQTGSFMPSRSVIRVNIFFDEEASYAPYSCFQFCKG
jgi:Fe-S-cluster-containing hydrogenase component 2